MNVVEINSLKTPISDFVIVAVMLVMLSYSVRLLIRSSTVTTAKQSLTSSVRGMSRTPPGFPIRTRDFLAWGIPGYRLVYQSLASDKLPVGWQLYTLSFLTIGAAFILPLSSIWSRSELISSAKTTISIAAMLPPVCALIGFMLYQFQNGVMRDKSRTKAEQRNQSLLLSRYHGTENED